MRAAGPAGCRHGAVRAGDGAKPSHGEAGATARVDIEPPSDGATRVQARLDGLLVSSTVKVHTPLEDVTVSIGFWIGPMYGEPDHARVVVDNKPELDAAAKAAGVPFGAAYLRSGKAPPQVLVRVTEALIARGRLPPPKAALTLRGRAIDREPKRQ